MAHPDPMAGADPVQRFLAHQQALRNRCQQYTAPQDAFDWLTPGYTIPGRIAELAARYPDRIAVYDERTTLTYRELDQAANRIAHGLLAEGGPDWEIVALSVGLDATSLVAALGVLKSGKAYVGFDDALTQGRCTQILEDTETTLLVYDAAHAAQAMHLAGSSRRTMPVTDLLRRPAHPPAAALSPDAIALLNYSSGTTGQPKGVVQSHHSALAQAAGFASMCHLGPADRVTNFSALAWAGAFWTLFGPLCFGATVATFDVRRSSHTHLAGWLARTGVTVVVGSTIVREFIAFAAELRFPAVRLASLGGDTIYRRDVAACQQVFPNALIDVGLGTTEAGRVAEWLIDANTRLEQEVVPVGLPAPGITIMLLDEHGSATAPGETGEIVVQSSYLAHGYWKRPDLTALKFRRDPRFGAQPLYRTGDLGRIGADGALHHMGRKDFQVKVRGYQVLANEIEGLLCTQPGILDACVVAQLGRDTSELLVAYVVLTPGFAWRIDELRTRLAATLPAYMTPQRFVFVPDLPKTTTGKVDRSRLPALSTARPVLSTPFVAPATPLESTLAAIWAAALDLDSIGVHDDFLALGGDSLRAAQIVNHVMAEFALDLPMTTMFAAATVSVMAAILGEHLASQMSAAELTAILDEIDSMAQDSGAATDARTQSKASYQ